MSFFLPNPQYPSCILFQQRFGILDRNLLSFSFEWSMSTAGQLQLTLTFKQTRAPHTWLLRVMWMAFSLICSSWSTMWCFNQMLFLFCFGFFCRCMICGCAFAFRLHQIIIICKCASAWSWGWSLVWVQLLGLWLLICGEIANVAALDFS